MSDASTPPILGLFEKRIDGDDALLDLARLRFHQSGMGAELHPGTVERLAHQRQFCQRGHETVVVHLPRDFDLRSDKSCACILEFARGGAGWVSGLVVHDHAELAVRLDDYLRAAIRLNEQLLAINRSPALFVEYAAGLEPECFANFFRAIQGLSHINACIDVGHVGIRQVRKAYSEHHPGVDICARKKSNHWTPAQLSEVRTVLSSALPAVLSLIESIGALKKPIHFHLHDGHPLSNCSPFGVSDHLSFLSGIEVTDGQGTRHSLPTMFGLAGLGRIATMALKLLGAKRVSFTLEIHPLFSREPLGADVSPLFSHWRDKTHAEQMNHWLSVLANNSEALRRVINNRR